MSYICRAPRSSLAAVQVRALATCGIAILALPAFAGEGLQAATLAGYDSLGWQARLSVSNLDPNSPAGMEAQHLPGSRLLSAHLLGDYYLTGSGLGGVRGGLRATGGMMLGPLSLSQSGSGLALGSTSLQGAQNLYVGQRSMSLLSPSRDLNDPNASLSYVGIGYTGQMVNSGISFSADLGLINNTTLGGLRLNPSTSPGLDDVLRDVRYKPLLQLGLSYSY